MDTGAVQHDSLALDEAETIRRAETFHESLTVRAARRSRPAPPSSRVTFVVSDAPPLACAAASLAGVPSAVCSNFTWDWIYSGYARHLQPGSKLLPVIRDAYALASAGWRLPMHGGFDDGACHRRRAVRRTAATARCQPRGDPSDTESARGQAAGAGVVRWIRRRGSTSARLPADRGRSARASRGESLAGVRRIGDVCGRLALRGPGAGRGRRRSPSPATASSRTASRPAPRCSTPRAAGSPNTTCCVAEMPRYLRCGFIAQEDLRAGRWREALDALAAAPPPPEKLRLDGASVVAEMIRGFL